MKLIKRITTVVILTLCITLMLALSVSADTEGEGIPAAAVYSVTHADGTVEYGYNADELCNAMTSAADGDRYKLLADVKTTRSIYITSTQDAPKTVYFDFAGHAYYSYIKRELFLVQDYTTAYFYSSAPGGNAYINTNEDGISLVNQSGCIFNIGGAQAYVYVGDFMDGETLYPGSNLSTFSSAFVNNGDTYNSDGTLNPKRAYDGSTFTVNGGNYFSTIADYTGFVIARGGEVKINLSDANFLFVDGTYPIHSNGEETEINANNCNFITLNSTTRTLFNSLNGKVTFTDCISNYPLKAQSGGKHFSMKGDTYLGYSSDFNMGLYKPEEGDNRVLVPARVTVNPELAQGGTTTYYYPDASNLTKYEFVMPRVAGAVLVEPKDTFDCRWIHGDTVTDEVWLNGQQMSAPYIIEGEGVPGFYKYGWKKTIDETGRIIFEGGKVLDFEIKVSVRELYGSAYVKVYIPFNMVDEGYFSVSNSSINGIASTRNDWKEIEAGGVMYYYTEIYVDAEDVNAPVNIKLACNFGDELIDTPWSVKVEDYIDRVLATEAEGTYSAEQYGYVKKMKASLFPEEESVAAAPALLPAEKKYA